MPGVDPVQARHDADRLATDDGWVPHPWPGSREPAAYLYDKPDGHTRLSLEISVQTQARTALDRLAGTHRGATAERQRSERDTTSRVVRA